MILVEEEVEKATADDSSSDAAAAIVRMAFILRRLWLQYACYFLLCIYQQHLRCQHGSSIFAQVLSTLNSQVAGCSLRPASQVTSFPLSVSQ